MLGDDSRQQASLALNAKSVPLLFHFGGPPQSVQELCRVLETDKERLFFASHFKSLGQCLPARFEQPWQVFRGQKPFHGGKERDQGGA